MSVESRLQSDIRRFLKSMGCYVLVIKPQPGIPDGCPDIIFMKEGFWGAAEIKTSKTSSFRPLQKETIEKLHEWSWCKAVYPDNWLETKIELEMIL